jgi:NADH-quinone oxidoreductase subunit M
MFLGKVNERYRGLPDLAWRERLTLYPLAALSIVLGFYPQAILGTINGTLHALAKAIGV